MADVLSFTIKRASERCGLSVDTIRYYERVGVLPSASRTVAGYRSYDRTHLETLKFARSLRDLGLPPRQLADLIRVFHNGTCRQMQASLAGCATDALARVMEQQQVLERVESQLRELIREVASISSNEQPSDGRPCLCVLAVEGGTEATAPTGGSSQ